jgi:hypothetical protein
MRFLAKRSTFSPVLLSLNLNFYVLYIIPKIPFSSCTRYKKIDFLKPTVFTVCTLYILVGILFQREGMGLLEYQDLPPLRDVAHDGWLCIFTIQQQLEIPSARSWAAPVRATGTAGVRPVHHVQNHTCLVTLLQQARRAAVLGQPSSLRPHCLVPLHGILQGVRINPQ